MCGFQRWVLPAAAVIFGVIAGPLAAVPENLALLARIESNSQFSGDYHARFVADGVVCPADARNDPGKAWAVRGDTHRNGAELVFEWPQTVQVGQIIYYGRTAWFLSECWKDFEVHTEDGAGPVLVGTLDMKHGPQRITLPRPATTRKLTIRFTSSYGGPNPGASEVQVFAAAASDADLAEIMAQTRLAGDPYYAADRRFESDPLSKALESDLAAGRLGFRSMVVIGRRPIEPSHVYTYHNEGFSPGGGLYILTADANGPQLTELLACPDGQILDCDLSFDAQEILFSMRRRHDDFYQVYRVGVDGSGLTQITRHESYNFNACWLPDGGIVFLSTRKPAFAYCWTSPVGILYRMNRDGGNVRRLSANYLNDFTPTVTGDGRIIYGRWEYVDRPAIPIQSLWTVSPDGTNLAVYYGNRVLSPATFIEARTLPDDTRILCTMTAHNGPCRGAIGIIDPAMGVNAQRAITNLTPEVAIGEVDKGSGNDIRGPYESPYPLDEEFFLVSRAGTLLVRDYAGTRQVVLLRESDGLGYYNAQPIRPRPVPHVIPSVLPGDDDAWATVIVQDVYRGLELHVERGRVKQICVVQEIEKSRMADTQYRAFGFQFPVVSCGATYAPKKVWGYVPVAEDGSACFKVPAGLPLYFMAIDEHGRAVQRMRSFTNFMPGEVRSCAGCHEPRHQSPLRGARPSSGYRAEQARPPVAPEWGLEGFSYAGVVQGVLDRHCVGCHGGPMPAAGVDLSGDETDFFNVSYETLAREGRPGENPYTRWIPTFNGMEANILLIEPNTWGSPVSRLADIVLTGHRDPNGTARVHLDADEQRRIFAWIDLNVPYYGTSLSNYYDREGCRRMVPPDFERTLEEVAARRCVSCHRGPDNKPVIPRKVWLRIANPHLNSFMLAPLAKSAGGTQTCGAAVFESVQDEDYQAVLRTFEPISRMLEQTPRMDMLSRRQTSSVSAAHSARPDRQ